MSSPPYADFFGEALAEDFLPLAGISASSPRPDRCPVVVEGVFADAFTFDAGDGFGSGRMCLSASAAAASL
jgi:hypothetical protein